MKKETPFGIAIVGCGGISQRYGTSIKSRPDILKLVGAYDINENSERKFCETLGCTPYPDLKSLLSDKNIQIVVNLTIQSAHSDITRACLKAGKHVFSEKPLALNRTEAQELVALADKLGLRLACAPFTWMGEAQQTAWKNIRDGLAGEIRVVYAEMNWSRIELWHPSPIAFFQAGVGPLVDVGVYPLTLLTTIFGPISKVNGFGKTVFPDRTTMAGEKFKSEALDCVVGGLEFTNGIFGRLTTSFYVPWSRQQGIEFHGDAGTIHLDSCTNFDAAVSFCPYLKKDWTELTYVKEPFKGVELGRGIFDLAEAIIENRPHRNTGIQAAHIVDVCNGINESIRSGKTVEIKSTFTPPSPMPWGI